MPDFAARRETMVASQLRPNRVTAPDVLKAFAETPREAYLPHALRDVAYADEHLHLAPHFAEAAGRYVVSPMVQAWLLQAARVKVGDKALDVGGGGGYSTALLARLGAAAHVLEEAPQLREFAATALKAQNVNAIVHAGPLTGSSLKEADFHVIMLNGAAQHPPDHLIKRLKDGGRLVCVLTRPSGSRIQVFERVNPGVRSRVVWEANAPVLPGFEENSGFVF
jgi:protein-L-isoaspartate(D-aspartate) O-methyltransferase